MARYFISPTDTLNRAIREGLPEGIEESGNALWAKSGAMLSVSPTPRSFRWVVTEADCMTDHEFAPSRFADALAALVALAAAPVPALAIAPTSSAQSGTGDALFAELFGPLA